jgi:uncharacterized protein YbaR (Trm112 family)
MQADALPNLLRARNREVRVSSGYTFFTFLISPFLLLFVNLARMKITEEFVEMMICPACQSKVRLREDGSAIKCLGCKRVYPIEDDMPMMLADKATIENEEAAERPA